MNRKSFFVAPPCWAGHIHLPMPIGLCNIGHGSTVASISPASYNDVVEVISDHRNYEILDLSSIVTDFTAGAAHTIYIFFSMAGTEQLELFLTRFYKSVHINHKKLYHGLRFPSLGTNNQPPKCILNCLFVLNPIHHPR